MELIHCDGSRARFGGDAPLARELAPQSCTRMSGDYVKPTVNMFDEYADFHQAR